METKQEYWKGYPKALWACSTAEIFERLAYYLGRSLILIFVTATVATGGLGFEDSIGAQMQSYMTGFSYLFPLIGGIIVDRFIGARYTTPVGMLIVAVGYYMGGTATSLSGVWAMIILVSVGLALFKNGNIIGRVVTDPKQLNSAYTIRYAFVNIGGCAGPFIAGILYKDVFAHDGILGFAPCFKLAAVVMVLGALWYFFVCWRYMGEVGRKPFKKFKTQEELEMEAKEKAKNAEARKTAMTTVEKKRIAAIGLGAICAIIFWIFWYLAYLPVYYYWGENANWVVLGYEVPQTWFDAANGLFCIILSPFVAKLWNRLAARPQGDWSIYRKAGVGIGIIGISYLFFFLLDVLRGGKPVSVLWLLIFAFLLTAGEMAFSPASNAFVPRYSPTRFLGTLSSLWSIAMFVSTITYGYVYSFLFGGNFTFSTGCLIVVVVTFIVALIVFALDKRLSSLVEDKED